MKIICPVQDLGGRILAHAETYIRLSRTENAGKGSATDPLRNESNNRNGLFL